MLYLLRLSLLEVPDRPPNTLARFARDDPELGCGLLGAAGVTRQYGSTPLEFVFYVNLRRPPYWSYCCAGIAPYGLVKLVANTGSMTLEVRTLAAEGSQQAHDPELIQKTQWPPD